MKDRDTLLLQEAYAAINVQHQLNESLFDTVSNAIEYLYSGAGAALLYTFRDQVHSILRKVGAPLKANKQELQKLQSDVELELMNLKDPNHNILASLKLYDQVIKKLTNSLPPTTASSLGGRSKKTGIRTNNEVVDLGNDITNSINSLIKRIPAGKPPSKITAAFKMTLLSIAIKQILNFLH